MQLTGELAQHAISEGTKAVSKFRQSENPGNSSGMSVLEAVILPEQAEDELAVWRRVVAAMETNRLDLSKYAGLQFSVNAMGVSLARYAPLFSSDAPVFLAAVIEYLAAEVLELSGNLACERQIRAHHVKRAISSDDELDRWYKRIRPEDGGQGMQEAQNKCAGSACRQTCSKCQQKFGSRNQLFKHLASTPCGRAPSPAAESAAAAERQSQSSMYYGCRVQVKSTCALNGECGRILCVSDRPAASAPNIWHDAMGRVVVEDGVGRMRVLGAWNADTGRNADTATPAPAFMNNMAPSSALTTSGMTYMCEFRVDGKLSVLPVEARNLSWLPGKPSNLPLHL